MKIDELPFRERPILELLALDHEVASSEYTGFGWARTAMITLSDRAGERCVRDALVIAVHASDVQPHDVGDDDLELEFELPGGPVAVLASTFLATWIPRLPRAASTVLAICNKPGHALPIARTTYAARGDVVAWLDEADDGDTRIRLAADDWRTG